VVPPPADSTPPVVTFPPPTSTTTVPPTTTTTTETTTTGDESGLDSLDEAGLARLVFDYSAAAAISGGAAAPHRIGFVAGVLESLIVVRAVVASAFPWLLALALLLGAIVAGLLGRRTDAF
jgi:hypothetical protein